MSTRVYSVSWYEFLITLYSKDRKERLKNLYKMLADRYTDILGSCWKGTFYDVSQFPWKHWYDELIVKRVAIVFISNFLDCQVFINTIILRHLVGFCYLGHNPRYWWREEYACAYSCIGGQIGVIFFRYKVKCSFIPMFIIWHYNYQEWIDTVCVICENNLREIFKFLIYGWTNFHAW